jgi:hypothetical protein
MNGLGCKTCSDRTLDFSPVRCVPADMVTDVAMMVVKNLGTDPESLDMGIGTLMNMDGLKMFARAGRTSRWWLYIREQGTLLTKFHLPLPPALLGYCTSHKSNLDTPPVSRGCSLVAGTYVLMYGS